MTTRIAVFRALYLGDLLVAVPALRALRGAYPQAEISLIGLPWAAEFTQRFAAYVDRFVTFPGYPGIAEGEEDCQQTERFLHEQRAYGYDLVLQMHGNGEKSNPFVHALGARETVGFYNGERPSYLTAGAPYPGDVPEVWRNLRLAELCGATTLDPSPEFPLCRADRAEAERLFRELNLPGYPLIGLHPGAKMPSRRWPAEYFAAAADELHRRSGAHILLTGGPEEGPIVREVADRMTAPVAVAAGRTSIGGLAALIERLDLFISNDTGPAHIADALQTPSIVLFGPTEVKRWAPLDGRHGRILHCPVPCSPCMHWHCPIDHRCLRSISPQKVVDLAQQLLGVRVAACVGASR